MDCLVEIKTIYRLLNSKIGFDPDTLRFLIPFPFNRKYLAVFKVRGEGFYCIMDELSGQVLKLII